MQAKKEKTSKMSTRKGNTILLEDVIDRSYGETVLLMMETDEAKKHHFTLMFGNFFRRLSEAHEAGEDKITFKISDYLE